MVWGDKRNVNMLTNMLSPPAEGYFYEENQSLKPAILRDYNRGMG
jgi:hypothetical protein